jgi:hypothetical protein
MPQLARGPLPGVEDEEARRDQAYPGGGVVPAQMLAEVEEGEDGEDHQRDDLLDHLELDGRKAVGADAVGRHLKQYSKKAMPQLTRMTFHSASWRNFRWPYQAKVMKMLEKMSRITVHMVDWMRAGWATGFSGSTMTALSENLERLEAVIAAACRRPGGRAARSS